jgi:hypothetical protein
MSERDSGRGLDNGEMLNGKLPELNRKRGHPIRNGIILGVGLAALGNSLDAAVLADAPGWFHNLGQFNLYPIQNTAQDLRCALSRESLGVLGTPIAYGLNVGLWGTALGAASGIYGYLKKQTSALGKVAKKGAIGLAVAASLFAGYMSGIESGKTYEEQYAPPRQLHLQPLDSTALDSNRVHGIDSAQPPNE